MRPPSARNSGLDRISWCTPDRLADSTRRMVSAVFTGTVLFSTMILRLVATLAIRRAHSSMLRTLEAEPAKGGMGRWCAAELAVLMTMSPGRCGQASG